MSRADRQAAESLARQVRAVLDLGGPRETPFEAWLADFFMRFLADRQQVARAEAPCPACGNTWHCGCVVWPDVRDGVCQACRKVIHGCD